jgi:hypothetical protein
MSNEYGPATMVRRWKQSSPNGSEAATQDAPASGARPAASGRQAARAHRQHQSAGRQAIRGTAQTVAQATAPAAADKAVTAAEPTMSHEATRKGGRMKRRVQAKVASAPDSGRMMSKARRAALAKGKQGLAAQKGESGSVANLMKMSNPTASGKEIAKQIRKERCKGKKSGDQQAGGESRRRPTRAQSGPQKVGESETDQGQAVTGSLVGQRQATGTEAGLCQRVSGTGYIGSEEISAHCQDRPQAGRGKKAATRTTGGQSVSGTTVGRSAKVSGDLAGQCASVTGTDYLPADQSEMFCGKQGKPRAERRKVTGGSVPSVKTHENKAPRKVVTSTTATGSRITGTQVNRAEKVTGDEHGFCKNVTGDGYQGIEDRQKRCDAPPAAGKTKVLSSSTFSGQRITGDRAGLGDDITGAEAGTCQKVTGTAYAGAEGARKYCTPEQAESIERAVKRRHRNGGFSISGTQPGPAGLTGAQQGVCEPVSGTPYQGQDQMSAFCASSRAADIGDLDFPQSLSTAQPDTADQQSALTGSFSQAVGKVTGDDMQVPRRGRAAVAPNPSEQAAANKVTGEGAQAGFAITGDAWDKGDRVTGTEGAWAQGRNPSMRGTPSMPVAAANDYRPVTAPPVPDSPVSGSAGTTKAGAKVTVSGGARA